MPTDVDIANRALIGIGSAPIQNFDEATQAARTVKSIYNDTIGWLLAFYPWSFTKETIELSQIVAPLDPEDNRMGAGWQYAYALPSDALGEPLAVFRFPRVPLVPHKDFAIEGFTLFTDYYTRLFATLQYAVDPNRWSAPFLKAAVACLAAELMIPMSGNSGMLEAVQAKAWGSPQENRRGGFLGDAIKFDARTQPSAILLVRDPLTDARWS
jgi:hypothetical protein